MTKLKGELRNKDLQMQTLPDLAWEGAMLPSMVEMMPTMIMCLQ